MNDPDDQDGEWEIPDQTTFDDVVAEAVFKFTEPEPDRILTLAWSSTGWDTGVGLIAMTKDDLQVMEDFRQTVASIEMDGQRFLTLPKQMLLRKYALTVYFGRPFARFPTKRLMYWLGLCNNLHGKFDLVETRYFPCLLYTSPSPRDS